MLPDLPAWITPLFLAAYLATVALFFTANRGLRTLLALILAWSAAQLGVAWTGFYHVSDALPPRFVLIFGPGWAARG